MKTKRLRPPPKVVSVPWNPRALAAELIRERDRGVGDGMTHDLLTAAADTIARLEAENRELAMDTTGEPTETYPL